MRELLFSLCFYWVSKRRLVFRKASARQSRSIGAGPIGDFRVHGNQGGSGHHSCAISTIQHHVGDVCRPHRIDNLRNTNAKPWDCPAKMKAVICRCDFTQIINFLLQKVNDQPLEPSYNYCPRASVMIAVENSKSLCLMFLHNKTQLTVVTLWSASTETGVPISVLPPARF